MASTIANLKRHEIRKAILSRRGMIAQIARDLDVSSTLITQVLRGRAVSARVYEVCERRAVELLQEAERGAA